MADPKSGDVGELLVSATEGGTYTAISAAREATFDVNRTIINSWSRGDGEWQKKIYGRKDGSVSFPAVWNKDDTQLTQIVDAFYNDTALWYKFRFQTVAGEEEWKFKGLVESISKSAPNDDVSMLDISIQVTGTATPATQS